MGYSAARSSLARPDPRKIKSHIAAFRAYKAARSQQAVAHALAALARAANDARANVFAEAVAAAQAGSTHGEICATLRRELGFGSVAEVV